MAIYIVYNGIEIPLSNISGGRHCAFIINSDDIPGAAGDVITDFTLTGTDITIETDGVGSPWVVDLSSLVNYLLPINTDSFNIQVNHLNVTPSGPALIYSLPDASLFPNGTLIGIKSGNDNSWDVTGGGTIDGQLNYAITQGESVLLASDGANWEIVANYLPPVLSTNNVYITAVSYLAQPTDNVIVVTANATISLPPATGSGITYRIVCRAGTTTIDGDGADTVKGLATQSLTAGEDLIITDTFASIWE